MTKREREKKDSLDALARIAASVGFGANEKPKPTPRPRAAAPLPLPKPKPAPPAKAIDPRKAAQLAERRAKLEDEKALKQRRANELQRGSSLQWRGMNISDVPSGIRRTAWDREPTLDQKVKDVLGDARKKESREKNSAKGKRQGGR